MELNALVMAPSKTVVWMVGRVQTHDGSTYVVKLENGEEVTVDEKEVVPVHEKNLISADDMTKLDLLHESLILHNLRQRYAQGIIYTYIGPMIISVNPYKKIAELGTHLIPEYQERDREELKPHLYAIAQKAYKSLMTFGSSQSIVISGESGSGKTEATKIVLKFLTVAAEHEADSELGDLAAMIIATNPILEAFGNAKTTRNDNSSRFGKFIKIAFDKTRISGVMIDNYLLEKTRIVKQAPTERNYHIFYQVISGMTAEEKAKYKLLNSEEEYHYLTNGCVEVPKINDKQDWEETVHAFSVLGFTQEEFDAVFTLLSAILCLGNICFVQDKEDVAAIKDDGPLVMFCDLLGLTNILGITRKSLLSRCVQVAGRGSVTFKPLSPAQAEANRDALSKRLYHDLFNWLVEKLNQKLKGRSSEQSKFIGVLDIYGFEIFDHNSLEQFCINYANEKLHQQFNHHMFKAEQEEYTKESVPWTKINFKDNSGCIELIERNRNGIISLLQEQCKIEGRGSDKGLIDEMKKNIKSVWFEKGHPSDPPDQFKIRHFAGTVTYSVDGFIEKNKDTLNMDLEKVMRKTASPLVSCFFLDEEEEERKKEEELKSNRGPFVASQVRLSTLPPKPTKTAATRDKKTVTVRFKEDLAKLVETLAASDRHYVRCIKPNDLRSDNLFDSEKVMSQLSCNGVFETVTLRKAGFSARFPVDRFIDKYWALLSKRNKEGIKVLLNEFNPDNHEWAIGTTKVFLRDSALDRLAEKLTQTWQGKAILIQSHIRRFNVNKKFVVMKASVVIQAFIRRLLAMDMFSHLVAVNQAAQVIQSYVRRYSASDLYFMLLQAYLEKIQRITVFQRYIRCAIATGTLIQLQTEAEQKRIEEEKRQKAEDERKKVEAENERKKAEAEKAENERKLAELKNVENERKKAELENMENERKKVEMEKMENERKKEEAENLENERKKAEAEKMENERKKAEAENKENERKLVEAENMENERKLVEAENMENERKKAEFENMENERKLVEAENERKNSEMEKKENERKISELEHKNKKLEEKGQNRTFFPIFIPSIGGGGNSTTTTTNVVSVGATENPDKKNSKILSTRNSNEKNQIIEDFKEKNPTILESEDSEEKNQRILLMDNSDNRKNSEDDQQLDEMLKVLESKNSSPYSPGRLNTHLVRGSRSSRCSRSPRSSRSSRSLRQSPSTSNIYNPNPKRLKRGISVSRPTSEESLMDLSNPSTPTLSPKGYHSQSRNTLAIPMLSMTYAHPRIPLAPLQVSRERSLTSSSSGADNGIAVILDLPSEEKKRLEDFFNSLGLPIAHIFFKEALDLNTILAWEDPEKQLKQLGIVQKGAIFRILKGLENLKRTSQFDPTSYGRPFSLSDTKLYNRPVQLRDRAATTAFSPRTFRSNSIDVIPEGPVISIRLGFLEAKVLPVKDAVSTISWARGVDLYVRCDVRKDNNFICQYRNKAIPKTLNPIWSGEEPLPMSTFTIPEGGSVHFEIWDESPVGDTKVAESVWTWEKIGYLRNGQVWVPLKYFGEFSGELHVLIADKVEHVVEYRWSPDMLGEQFETFSFSLVEDKSGPQRGTLIRRISESEDTTSAVLYIHDFSDYFWQLEIGVNFTLEGYHFYALDLRKYGRNFSPENNFGPNSARNIMEYYEEVHLVVEFIRKVEGVDKLLLCGSGFGGLLATLFAADHPQGIDGLCLLSPMFSLNPHWDNLVQSSQNWFGTIDPTYQDTQFSLQYHQSLHKSLQGEHEWDLTLKPMGGFPINVMWVKMVQEAQKRVSDGSGLNLGIPILVLCAQKSVIVKEWEDDVLKGDVLLAVEGIVAVAAKLGRYVKTQLIQNGIHDVLLSCKSAREDAFDLIFEYFLWMVDGDEFRHPIEGDE